MTTPKGKQVAVDYSPSNYTASGSVEDHVAGIDTALGGKSATGHTHTESDITDLDHTDTNAIHVSTANEITGITQKVTPANDDVLLIEDSEASYVKKRVLVSAVSGVGTHASSHITGQSDEIDGDKLDIDWNPSNYTPTTDPSEADNVDNLTAHLAGIDNALVVEVGGGLETIAYVDSTQANASTGATLTLTKPTGVVDDDLLLAFVVLENYSSETWDTVPSGWTLLVDGYNTGGSPGSQPRLYVWYKVASSEGSDYSWILSASGVGIIGAMAAYRNVDTSTPMDATRTLANGDNATSSNPPSITTVTNGAFVVAAGFHDDDTGYDTMSSGYDEREDVADASGGNGATLGVCDNEIASAGPEDPGTMAHTGSDSEEWGAVTIALRPATAAPTTYTLASHAARHVQGGGDEVDGDELDIDFTPSNYSPATGTPGSDVDHLAAHLRGIDTYLGTRAALTSTAPVNVTKATAAVGVGTTAARHDHKHDITTATPSAVGTANAEGTSSSLARADHVHDASALLPRDGTRAMTGTLSMSNNHLDDIATAHYNTWQSLTPSGGAVTVNYANYQAATVTLNASTVTITLATPRGPGAFKLLVFQDSAGGRSITWASATGSRYAPNGAVSIATASNARTLIGLIFDGTNWYIVSSQPMQTV